MKLGDFKSRKVSCQTSPKEEGKRHNNFNSSFRSVQNSPERAGEIGSFNVRKNSIYQNLAKISIPLRHCHM
jgi:hypothetical protein